MYYRLSGGVEGLPDNTCMLAGISLQWAGRKEHFSEDIYPFYDCKWYKWKLSTGKTRG